MTLNNKFQTLGIRAFLKEYRRLVSWLIWGICMSLWFGLATRNCQTRFAMFMGFGISLGLITQFVKVQWHRVLARCICLAVAIIIVWNPVLSFLQVIARQKISQHFLVDDVRQMASILGSIHPDPYSHGGGRIALHRRMQNLIGTIRENGLAQTEFLPPPVPAYGGHWRRIYCIVGTYHLNNQPSGGYRSISR